MQKCACVSEKMVPMSDTCILIPTYNNAGTIAGVVRRALDQGLSVIVVDDGSTDGTSSALAGLDVTVLRQDPNRGKGIALRTGLRAARERGFRYAVTLDADGQHYPEDVPALLAAGGPRTLVVGSRNLSADGMPSGNTFANKFSNFWSPLWLMTARYEAELTLLVFSAWRGLRLIPVPVRVAYHEDRVSHFRPLADFSRISLLNTLLCLLALVYGYPSMLLRKLFSNR